MSDISFRDMAQRLLTEAGLPNEDDALDDLVHDIFSAQASEINNRGRDAQCAALGRDPATCAVTSWEDLCEDVHDSFSRAASSVNNEGPLSQVATLLEHGVTEADIRAALRPGPDGPA